MTMRYTLLIYESQEEFAQRSDPERKEAYLAGWSHYVNAIRESGVVVGGSGLYAPETATSLRRSDGKMLVQDGPITDTKEQLGGLFILEVPDLETALEWATRCPCEAVEVRQCLPTMK
jgi:hypothetical protein